MALGNVSTTDILNVPQPTKESGQRSMRVSDAYFARMVPGWSQPSVLTPGQWRAWVASQPVAVTCKETMVSNIADLDWKITPRESDMRDELKGTIGYYEKFLRNGGYSGLDYIGFLEWFINDLNDLPFGTAWEVGRKGDSPEGRAAWMEPLDGGTLYPTNNKDFPVIQYYNNFYATFPAHAIARAYLNPRTEIERKGWGMAPPEKIFLAMEMLARGDRYYANLLLDIPPVGVFDMADITWEDAHTWIESFRTFTQGGPVDGFRIPVLAEHQKDVKFIPLGKDPNAIMYDVITLKYAALTVAGYGMSLGDIGLQGSSASGETLAGSIRSEQKTNRTGKARNKGKIKYFIESILPPTLQFDFIDTDGERLSMLGRARLANATAMNQFHQMGSISPEEGRLQMIQDGLFTISMPEKPPREATPPPKLGAFGKPAERPGSVGSPQAPSLGGDGEVKASLTVEKGRSFNARIGKLTKRICEYVAPILTDSMQSVSEDELYLLRSAVDESLFGEEDVFGIGEILKAIWVQENWVSVKNEDIEILKSLFAQRYIWELTDEEINKIDFAPHFEELKHRVSSEIKVFIGKSIVSMLKDSILSEGDSMDCVGEIQKNIVNHFAEFSAACVQLETDKLLSEIRNNCLTSP